MASLGQPIDQPHLQHPPSAQYATVSAAPAAPGATSSAASSPTKPLFHLPDLRQQQATGAPLPGARSSMARSSMATTLGGTRPSSDHGAFGGNNDVEKAARSNSPHGGEGRQHGEGQVDGGSNEDGPTLAEQDGKPKPLWAKVMSKKNKNHFVAAMSEYVGTTLFLFFAFGGTNVANIPSVSVTDSVVNTSNLLYIALSFGFSLTVNAWVFFRVSGGLFNPAVSLGLALVGAIEPLRAAYLVFAQLLGGITGAALIDVLLPGPLYVRTTLTAGMSISRGLFLEMFLTSMLMLAILFLAAEKHKATFLAPVGIGLALFIAELVGVYYTGGSLNPARTFGPDVVSKQFSGYTWIYFLGPALGASLAAGLYKLLKYFEYEDVVPNQDAGPAATEPLTEEEGEHHGKRIKEAETIAKRQLAHHFDVVERTGAERETQQLTMENYNAARIGELSAKLDAVLAAVTAINIRDRDQRAGHASGRGTPSQLGREIVDKSHDAPYSVLPP